MVRRETLIWDGSIGFAFGLANGLSESRRIGELAALYDTMISPHNYMSPYGTLVNAHLCAAIPNLEILEYDADDVGWKMDLITEPLRIEAGVPNAWIPSCGFQVVPSRSGSASRLA